jgi:hypothetical protein
MTVDIHPGGDAVPYSFMLAALMTVSVLFMVSHDAHAGRKDQAQAVSAYGETYDLHGRVSRSYEQRRAHRKHHAHKRVKRDRSYAYPNSPWGPFPGPPGLF